MTGAVTDRPAIPAGLCQCGCGQPTPAAPKTSRRDRVRAGQPRRWIQGHNTRGLVGQRKPGGPPADVPAGTPRCARCRYPLLTFGDTGPTPPGWCRPHGRGLCGGCHNAARRHGTLIDYSRRTWTRHEVLAEVEVLHDYRIPRAELSERIGISERALRQHLRAGVADADPRASLYPVLPGDLR